MSNAPNKECCCCSNLSCRKPAEITTEYPKRKLLTRAMESFYENCAAYNLRYIPYRTLTDRRTCLKSITKDFVVLFCFLVTNFVVFLTILSRIAMHLGGVMLAVIEWIKNLSIRGECYVRGNQKKPVLCLLYSEKANGTSFEPPMTLRSRNCNNSTNFEPSMTQRSTNCNS